MDIYNSEHGKYIATDSDEWSYAEPQARLRDAVYQYINDSDIDAGDAIQVGMCKQWMPDALPALEQYKDAVWDAEWSAGWLRDITSEMEASFKRHMQDAALDWLKRNNELPEWCWVRHIHTITVTKELMTRYYREYKLYSDEDIADLWFGGEDDTSAPAPAIEVQP